MINLQTLFKNHFDTDRVSDDNFRKFVEIFLQRTAVQNEEGGQYTAVLTLLTNGYEAYYGAITDEATDSALQVSLTRTVENLVEQFKDLASDKEGIVRGEYGSGSAKYLAFYPHGITEFRNANLGNISRLMDQLVKAFTDDEELPEKHALALSKVVTDFKAGRKLQLKKIGEVKDGKTETADSRGVLEKVVAKAILLIAADNVGLEERARDFFDQSFLRDSGGADAAETTSTNPTT